MTDDLVAWLRAQLDWQEEIAHKWQAKDEEADRLFVGHCSPSWTLREVEAKRRLVELHARDHDCADWEHRAVESWGGRPCATLYLLAQPYSDRPGYRGGWLP